MTGKDLAYEFVRPSYELLNTRFDQANGRLHNAVAFIAGFTVASSTLIATVRPMADFSSKSYLFALAFAIIAILVSLFARHRGELQLVDPGGFTPQELSMPASRFKDVMIGYAHRHFESNARVIAEKNQAAFASWMLFTIESMLILGWAVSQLD